MTIVHPRAAPLRIAPRFELRFKVALKLHQIIGEQHPVRLQLIEFEPDQS